MSEELIQRNLVEAPEKMGDWNFYNIGATTLKALKNAKIIPNRDYAEFEGKKPDALIVKKPLVIAAIEYKTPQELRTKTQIAKAIAQELGTACALQARVYIVTDGKKSFWVNPSTGNEILQEDGSKVTLNFDKNSTECIALISKIRSSINARNDQLKATAMVDPLPLAERVWQDLWSVSGATPENCLYTFVEIFIFKYLSDLGVLKNMHSFYDLLNLYSGNNENEVLEYYASTIRVKIKELFPQNQADKTTIINGTIFVSKDDKAVEGYGAVFHRILKRFNDFGTLENIDYDFKSKLFETFLKESISKKNWGQYFTPLKVVRAIVNMVDLLPGMEVCDPACGVGKFLLEPICNDLHRFFLVEDGKLKPQIALHGFDKGFDKEEQKTIILAKANMLIYFSGMLREHPDLTKEFAELFNNTFLLQTNSILGTLARPETDKYDLILTNPPYVMSGSSNLKEEIGKQTELKQHYAINAMGIEGLFMEWIVRALKPGGKAFIVVPDGIMNRSNDKKLRDYILEQCVIDAVISLPLNTFFTTNKKTYILALTKKTPVKIDGISTLERQSSPVFTYLCSEIGETRDVNRFDIDQNDLAVASDLFNMFKGAKTKFRIDDLRCKIVSIDDFYVGGHWCIERWWTKEDKITLGIESESESISVDDFISMLTDVSSSVSGLEEPLRELQKKKGEVNFVPVVLSKIIDFSVTTNSSAFTKAFVNSNQGDIPVYGASKQANEVSYGYIKDDIPGVKYFSDCLTWNIDGSIGLFIRNGKFSLSEKVIPLIVRPELNKDIDLNYLRYTILSKIEDSSFSYTNKGGKSRLGQIIIPLPVTDEGYIDITVQKEIADKYAAIEQTKSALLDLRMQLTDISVVFEDEDYDIEFLPLPLLFDREKGLAKYTKKYGDLHSGKYPVYSASSQKPLTHLDTYDYDGRYMTWATNGFAGTILILDGRFSINGDRGILLPKDDRTDLDFDYMKFVLEPIFREMAKGRRGDNGEDEFTKLYPSMLEDVMIPVPVDHDKHISLEAQKSIAKKYLTIQQCQQEAVKKLDTLISQKVSV